jgi:two-component system LytT family sensor kinase
MRSMLKIFAARFSLVFGLWTLVALCNAGADYLIIRVAAPSSAFIPFLRGALCETWTWAALTPIVFLIARRFPLSKPGLTRALFVHLACFFLLSLLHSALLGVVDPSQVRAPAHYQGSLLVLRFLEEIYSDIWMYWPLVCIQALLDSRARTRDRDRVAAQLEAQLAKSSLALLRAQIQPHFLFNTLNAVSALIRFDALAAEGMVADLAEVLRASFADPTSQETTLRHELQLVRCYLRIQCRRFDRLTVDYAVSAETLDAMIPALVLQSLVENAVVHGVAPAERPGTISIQADQQGDRLVLKVVDNGMGLKVPLRDGVGLSNARSRLRHLYADCHFITLSGEPDRGTTITVSIPFRVLSRGVAGASIDHENSNPDRGRRSPRPEEPFITVGG